MRFASCLIVSTMILVGCTTAEERFLEDRLDENVKPQQGSILLALLGADGSIDTVDKGDAPLDPDAAIRIASITKAFTSALVLTLIDDGVIDLDAAALAYVPHLSLPGSVTVRHLFVESEIRAGRLHTAGHLQKHPGRQLHSLDTRWALSLIEDEGLTFHPGSRFEYTNTNHMILGLLVEEVTGHPYHQALRERILDPLGLDATYLSYYEQGETPHDAYTEQLGDPWEPLVPVDFDYTAIATTVWSAGGLVSSAVEVHQFFTAMSKGDIIAPKLFSEMTTEQELTLGETPHDATTTDSVSNSSKLRNSSAGQEATFPATSPWSCTHPKHSRPSCMSPPTTDTTTSHGY